MFKFILPLLLFVSIGCNHSQEITDQKINFVTINIKNSDGSITPVTIKRVTKCHWTLEEWMGPKGDLYSEIPTSKQLQLIHGY